MKPCNNTRRNASTRRCNVVYYAHRHWNFLAKHHRRTVYACIRRVVAKWLVAIIAVGERYTVFKLTSYFLISIPQQQYRTHKHVTVSARTWCHASTRCTVEQIAIGTLAVVGTAVKTYRTTVVWKNRNVRKRDFPRLTSSV